MDKRPRKHLWPALWVAVGLMAVAAPVRGLGLSGAPLVQALRQGGYVLLMRHASSPRTPPDPGVAEADNAGRERQLDETGRATAQAMGQAFKTLRIQVGQVLS